MVGNTKHHFSRPGERSDFHERTFPLSKTYFPDKINTTPATKTKKEVRMSEIRPPEGRVILRLRREGSNGLTDWCETVPLARTIFVLARVLFIVTAEGRFNPASVMFHGPYRRPTISLAARRILESQFPGKVLFTVEDTINSLGQPEISGYFVFANGDLAPEIGRRLWWYNWRFPHPETM